MSTPSRFTPTPPPSPYEDIQPAVRAWEPSAQDRMALALRTLQMRADRGMANAVEAATVKTPVGVMRFLPSLKAAILKTWMRRELDSLPPGVRQQFIDPRGSALWQASDRLREKAMKPEDQIRSTYGPIAENKPSIGEAAVGDFVGTHAPVALLGPLGELGEGAHLTGEIAMQAMKQSGNAMGDRLEAGVPLEKALHAFTIDAPSQAAGGALLSKLSPLQNKLSADRVIRALTRRAMPAAEMTAKGAERSILGGLRAAGEDKLSETTGALAGAERPPAWMLPAVPR